MLDLPQLQKYVIRPALEKINMGGLAAEQLVLGTWLVESKLVYIDQIGRGTEAPGPAYGLGQMEAGTHDWLWRWLHENDYRIDDFLGLCIGGGPSVDQLHGNLYLAAAMTRLRYWVAPFKMCAAGDWQRMAHLWKMYYNTPAGAGTEERAGPRFKTVCDIIIEGD